MLINLNKGSREHKDALIVMIPSLWPDHTTSHEAVPKRGCCSWRSLSLRRGNEQDWATNARTEINEREPRGTPYQATREYTDAVMQVLTPPPPQAPHPPPAAAAASWDAPWNAFALTCALGSCPPTSLSRPPQHLALAFLPAFPPTLLTSLPPSPLTSTLPSTLPFLVSLLPTYTSLDPSLLGFHTPYLHTSSDLFLSWLSD